MVTEISGAVSVLSAGTRDEDNSQRNAKQDCPYACDNRYDEPRVESRYWYSCLGAIQLLVAISYGKYGAMLFVLAIRSLIDYTVAEITGYMWRVMQGSHAIYVCYGATHFCHSSDTSKRRFYIEGDGGILDCGIIGDRMKRR